MRTWIQKIQPKCARLLISLPLVLVVLLTGCGSEKESTHEHEHELPDHWPSNMAQAAEYIKIRVSSLDSSSAANEKTRAKAIEELQDLVEWSPEIAGDTDLPEEDWNPIYETSEAIRKHMLAGDVEPTAFASDFEKLTGLLLEAHTKVDAIEAKSQEALGGPSPEDEESESDTASESSAEEPDEVEKPEE